MQLFGSDTIIEAALALPLPDRLEVLNRLWDSMPVESGSAFLDQETLAELDRRLAYEDAHPDDYVSWEEVKANVPRDA